MTRPARFLKFVLIGLFIAIALGKVADAFAEMPGLIIEEMGADSPAAKLGLKVGDRLMVYGDRPLLSPAALQAAQENIVSKQQLTIQVQRGEQSMTLIVSSGKLGVTVRPFLPQAALALYAEAKTAEQERRVNDAISLMAKAAKAVQEYSDQAAAGWLYERAGGFYEMQKKWQEAQKIYLAGWEIVRVGNDAAAQARLLEGLARSSRNLNDYASARSWYEQAVNTNAKADNALWAANDLSELGNIARSHSDFQNAEAYYRRALAIRERVEPDSLEVAKSFNNLGNVAFDRGDLQVAEDYIRMALAIRERLAPESLDVATSLNNLGNVVRLRGNLQEAENYHRRALTIRERERPNSLDVSMSLGNLGVIEYLRGNLQAARDYHHRAFAIAAKLAPNSHEAAICLNNLGNDALARSDLQAAEDYHRRALTIREHLSPGSVDVGASLNNLGIVASARGDLEATEEYYRCALAIKQRLADDSLDVAITLNNLGNVAFNRNDLQAAEHYHRRALAIRERLAPDSIEMANSLNNLGNVLHSCGNLQDAHAYLSRALAIRERLAPDSLDVSSTLNGLGELAFTQGQLQDTLQYFSRAVSIIESLRGEILSPEGRALFVQGNHRAYYGLLRAHLAVDDLPAAFATIERARARSLVEILAERRVDFRTDVSSDLLRQQDELNQERSDGYFALKTISFNMATTQSNLSRFDSRDKKNEANHLKEQIEDLKNQITEQREQLNNLGIRERELEEEIRRASPRLHSLQYPKPLVLKEAQAVLDTNTLLLTYYVAEKETYLFAVTKSDIKVFTLPVGIPELNTQVIAFRNEVGVYRPDLATASRLRQATEPGKRLYDTLIRPAQKLVDQAKRILICPEGPLHTLPFAALVSQSEPRLRYFIEDKPLHTIASMTVYAEIRRTEMANRLPQKKLLLFGDPIYSKEQLEATGAQKLFNHVVGLFSEKSGDDKSNAEAAEMQRRGFNLTPLPSTRQEVQSIGALYRKSASINLGQQATEATARKISNDYRIIHFAAHGWLDEQVGLNSTLALSQPELLGRQATSNDNGLLQAWEIFGEMKLNADLVVLSACDTGGGQNIRGEGVIGLTRAFQFAGAKSVVVSLWDVSDESTATLMKAFYQELQSGVSKDVALQRAMAVVRRNPTNAKWKYPYYWSPFVLAGDWR